jgi:hypothetical protein
MQWLAETSSAMNPEASDRLHVARTVPTCSTPRYADPTLEIQGIGRRVRALTAILAVVGSAIAATAGCSRTGLDPADFEAFAVTPTDAGLDVAVEPEPEAGPDAEPEAGDDASSHCVPAPEECNGKDDDCNGHVDDGIASIPCPGGGARYCVAGRMSACPERCEVCVPGSERVCFLSYCQYWAIQTCTADGRSFGVCREHAVPSECEASISTTSTVKLEQCCLDHGYCCLDVNDLDHDGDRKEMIGNCAAVTCDGAQ